MTLQKNNEIDKELDEYGLKVASWLMTLCIAITERKTTPLQGVELLEMAAREWKNHLGIIKKSEK